MFWDIPLIFLDIPLIVFIYMSYTVHMTMISQCQNTFSLQRSRGCPQLSTASCALQQTFPEYLQCLQRIHNVWIRHTLSRLPASRAVCCRTHCWIPCTAHSWKHQLVPADQAIRFKVSKSASGSWRGSSSMSSGMGSGRAWWCARKPVTKDNNLTSIFMFYTYLIYT